MTVPAPPPSNARPPCGCTAAAHVPRLVVLTGGPGAGKTAVLEVIRRNFCEHIAVLPESASILFGGGFPRRPERGAREAAQRAIARVQRELERMAVEEARAAVVLCDRGTVDGLAYWPGAEADFWSDLGTSRAAELARYAAVIHLRTPADGSGYDHSNPVRTESAREACEIDARIGKAWDGHPRRFFIESSAEFIGKVAAVISLVRAEVPECCRGHAVPEIDRRPGPA